MAELPGYVTIDGEVFNPERIEELKVSRKLAADGLPEETHYHFTYNGQPRHCLKFGGSPLLEQQIAAALAERAEPGYVDPIARS